MTTKMEGITLTGPEIELYRLNALRQALILESKGMTRRGKSATSIARALLGMKRGASRISIQVALDAHIEKFVKDNAI